MKKNFKQRIITFFGALAILIGAYYGYKATTTKQDVLLNGQVITAPISRITSKRTIYTIFVEINGVDLNAGETFGDCNTKKPGDTIKVHYKPGSEYVVLYGKKSFKRMLMFEYFAFALGGLLIVMVFFYNGD